MSELQPFFYNVPEFCDAAKISRSLFYSLQREGRGPRMTKLGDRSLISTTDARAWIERLPTTPAQAA
jgi:predicted DNA-binding transcriptional regulator AlpA